MRCQEEFQLEFCSFERRKQGYINQVERSGKKSGDNAQFSCNVPFPAVSRWRGIWPVRYWKTCYTQAQYTVWYLGIMIFYFSYFLKAIKNCYFVHSKSMHANDVHGWDPPSRHRAIDQWALSTPRSHWSKQRRQQYFVYVSDNWCRWTLGPCWCLLISVSLFAMLNGQSGPPGRKLAISRTVDRRESSEAAFESSPQDAFEAYKWT